MATVTDRDTGRRYTEPGEIARFLGRHGIWYRRWDVAAPRAAATDEEILERWGDAIAELRARGGYATADVIAVRPDTPGLDDMMRKFATEHRHREDEVRIVVSGRGLFHVHPDDGPVFSIEVVAGDAINVPAGTRHWFHLCEDRSIRAIRLFEDAAGWVPEYTGSGVDARYQPLCFGGGGR